MFVDIQKIAPMLGKPFWLIHWAY